MMNLRYFLSTCLLSSTLALPVCAQDPVYNFDAADPQMNAAIAEAQNTLGYVLAVVSDEDGNFHPALSLKVAIELASSDPSHEIIWVDTIALGEKGFEGRLANDPNFFDGKTGDLVKYRYEDVQDWGLISSDGELYGHYTTRVLLADLPQDQATQIADLLADEPFPKEWQ